MSVKVGCLIDKPEYKSKDPSPIPANPKGKTKKGKGNLDFGLSPLGPIAPIGNPESCHTKSWRPINIAQDMNY